MFGVELTVSSVHDSFVFGVPRQNKILGFLLLTVAFVVTFMSLCAI